MEAIRHKLTGKKHAILEPLSVAMERIEPGSFGNLQATEEYEFKVLWRVIASCERQDFYAMQNNVVRELREAIYGQFRERVLMLERAIYEHDREKVLMHTRDLIREVEGHY
jgi:hypothetical protein